MLTTCCSGTISFLKNNFISLKIMHRGKTHIHTWGEVEEGKKSEVMGEGWGGISDLLIQSSNGHEN